MATIYRAVDTQLGRDVAVKLLRPEYLRDPDFSSRFRQEAQAAASLSHPNVVTVFDYGEDPSGPYIVMELVDGEDLATILRRSGALPPRQAARIAAAVAQALAAAHARGLVHRDVKPGNVLIGRDGRVKVADFGIARAIAEAQLTLPGTTLGLRPLLQPGAGPRRAGDRVVRHLLAGHRPVRDADRRPAVGGRQRRVRRARPADRTGPGSDRASGRRPARPRRDHPQGARPRARRPLRLRRRWPTRSTPPSRPGAPRPAPPRPLPASPAQPPATGDERRRPARTRRPSRTRPTPTPIGRPPPRRRRSARRRRPRTRTDHEPARLDRRHRRHPAARGHRLPRLPARRRRRCDAVRLTDRRRHRSAS